MVELLTGQCWFRAGYWENRSSYDQRSFSSRLVRSVTLASCRLDCDWNTKLIWTTATSNIQHPMHRDATERERQEITYTVSHQSLPWIRDGEETKQTDRGNGKDEKDEDIQRRELILSDEDVEAKMGCRKRKMTDGCWMFWKRKTFSAFINISARRFQDCLQQQTHRDVTHRSVDDRSDALSSAAPSWFVWGQKWPYLDDFCLSIVFLTLNGTKTYKMNIMLC